MAKRKTTTAKAKPAPKPEPITYEIGQKILGYIVTKEGLPNNCSATGQPIQESYWFARNRDEARSGLGICQAEFEKLSK